MTICLKPHGFEALIGFYMLKLGARALPRSLPRGARHRALGGVGPDCQVPVLNTSRIDCRPETHAADLQEEETERQECSSPKSLDSTQCGSD